MEVRECQPDDVISLLHCASDDTDNTMFDDWAQYQKWLLDAVYSNKWHVIIADDGFGVIGFLIWNLHMALYKWKAYLNYIYVGQDFRDSSVSMKLVKKFIDNSWSSSAQRWEFSSKVLPSRWVNTVALNAPLSKYMTYHAERGDELREWFDESIRKHNNTD